MLWSCSGIGDREMRRAVRAACVVWALSVTPALAQDVTLLEKFKDWSAYAATGSPKVCFAVAKPKQANPQKIKRGPIFFYISRWPADNVTNEISVKMGYPFGAGAKATVTVGTAKFELFTKDEGAFVMKIEGKSARGTATSDIYSLDGLSDALDRAAKECSG